MNGSLDSAMLDALTDNAQDFVEVSGTALAAGVCMETRWEKTAASALPLTEPGAVLSDGAALHQRRQGHNACCLPHVAQVSCLFICDGSDVTLYIQ